MATRRLALVLALASLTGCLEREEKITVGADGALDIVHVLKGDAAEFGPGGDALPAGPTWQVTDRDTPKKDGGTERVREARARFARAADVPRGFGAPDDVASLTFTTDLQVERLEDGSTRYTFERRYAPRAWAWRERLLEKHLPQEVRDRLSGKTPGAIEGDLKRAAVAGLLAFERAKGQELVERALSAVAVAGEPRAVATRRAARARAAYRAGFEATWKVDDLMRFLAASPAEQAELGARFHAETRRLAIASAVDAAIAEGAPAGARAALEDAVGRAYGAERARLEATEDQQDETFRVRVTFPGPVVLGDADALADGGRTAVFEFHGKDLADRELVLRAVAISKP